MRAYTYGTTLSFGTDGEPDYCEVDVEVTYEVDFGTPETGRFGRPEDYDPGSDDEVHSIQLLAVDGTPRPWGQFMGDDAFAAMVVEKVEANQSLLRAMAQDAAEDEAARADDYAEMRAEERRMEARHG